MASSSAKVAGRPIKVDLKSEEQLLQLCKSYKEVHLFIGYGAKAQFQDVEEVLAALRPHMLEIERRCEGQKFLAVFGGDKAIESAPDLGWLMLRVQHTFNCDLLAIQSAGVPDDHVNYAFVCEQQFETVKELKDGVYVETKEVLYGGTRNGKPVGGTRYYLGPDFITKSPQTGKALLKGLWVTGGGGVGLDELKYADSQGVPWTYIPARGRNQHVYGSVFGPVHEWAKQRIEQVPPERALVSISCLGSK